MPCATPSISFICGDEHCRYPFTLSIDDNATPAPAHAYCPWCRNRADYRIAYRPDARPTAPHSLVPWRVTDAAGRRDTVFFVPSLGAEDVRAALDGEYPAPFDVQRAQ